MKFLNLSHEKTLRNWS